GSLLSTSKRKPLPRSCPPAGHYGCASADRQPDQSYSCIDILFRRIYLPAGLVQARHVASHRRFAQLVASKAELAIEAVRTPRHLATVTLSGRACIPRELRQLFNSSLNFLSAAVGALDDALELRALGGILSRQLLALHFPVDHR